MWFVVGPSKISRSKLPYVVLEKDNWDDYGYKTTFKATFWRSANDSVDLGSIKILKLGQIGGYTPMPEKPFEALGPDYCSVGVDLGYYEKLFKLGASVYRPYLEGIADVAYSDEIRAKFEDLEGYRVSLLRFSGEERTIMVAARLFASATPMTRKKGKGFVVRFKTTLADRANFVRCGLRLQAKRPPSPSDKRPDRLQRHREDSPSVESSDHRQWLRVWQQSGPIE